MILTDGVAQAVWNPSGVGIAVYEIETIKVWYSNGVVNWEYKLASEGNLDIYNIVGERIATYTLDSEKDSESLNLKKGIYIANFNTDQKKVLKFVVQ